MGSSSRKCKTNHHLTVAAAGLACRASLCACPLIRSTSTQRQLLRARYLGVLDVERDLGRCPGLLGLNSSPACAHDALRDRPGSIGAVEGEFDSVRRNRRGMPDSTPAAASCFLLPSEAARRGCSLQTSTSKLAHASGTMSPCPTEAPHHQSASASSSSYAYISSRSKSTQLICPRTSTLCSLPPSPRPSSTCVQPSALGYWAAPSSSPSWPSRPASP